MSDTTPRDQLGLTIYDTLNGQYGDFNMPDDAAEAILNAGWRPPARVVSTWEELEALPEESIILDAGVPAYLLDGLWSYPADQSDYEAGEIKLPVTVLYEPEEGE